MQQILYIIYGVREEKTVLRLILSVIHTPKTPLSAIPTDAM